MLKRFILWDFPRASWQYDVMVGIIVAFIFLTPRAWFRDQPKPSNIAMLPSGNGASSFFIDSALLSGVPKDRQIARLTELIERRSGGHHVTIVRVEPILNAEGELEGYMAFARP